jgi:hypothetical protein
MNNERFFEVVEKQHIRRKKMMQRPDKARVAGSTDRLIQFKRMAAINKETPAESAVHLCVKQFTDIIDMADGTHPLTGNLKYMRELVADVQNYLDLTLANAEESWLSIGDLVEEKKDDL